MNVHTLSAVQIPRELSEHLECEWNKIAYGVSESLATVEIQITTDDKLTLSTTINNLPISLPDGVKPKNLGHYK